MKLSEKISPEKIAPTSPREVVIKQYRSTGRCIVHTCGVLTIGGVEVAGVNRQLQSATIPLEDKQEQRAAVLEVMDRLGYEMATFGRDDWGNDLLMFVPIAQARKAA